MTTAPSPSDPASVALELERIRRTIEVGFTRTDGALALLVQKHDQTVATLNDHASRMDAHASRMDTHDARLDTLERGDTERQKRNDARLAELERARWPLPSLAALVGVVSLVVALWQATQN
ncbi:hypothetical protein ACFY1C_20880 [Streptomyces sp. NPDC001279]|uniref:hypothetical protein n=1 Tax=unclassified Streptomyces TaxID=2593676 RepID=UPI0036996CA7